MRKKAAYSRLIGPVAECYAGQVHLLTSWFESRLALQLRAPGFPDQANRSAPAWVKDRYPPDACIVIYPRSIAAFTAALYSG